MNTGQLNPSQPGWICNRCGAAVRKDKPCENCGGRDQIRDEPK